MYYVIQPAANIFNWFVGSYIPNYKQKVSFKCISSWEKRFSKFEEGLYF